LNKHERAIELLEEANQLDPRNPVVMDALGNRLITGNMKDRGRKMLKEANELFKEMLNEGSLDTDDIGRAKRLASFLNDKDFIAEINKYVRCAKILDQKQTNNQN
jgi:hypothetical protein